MFLPSFLTLYNKFSFPPPIMSNVTNEKVTNEKLGYSNQQLIKKVATYDYCSVCFISNFPI
jgi:hypothetical protein